MKYLVAISAIGAIAWLDVTAIWAGIDGVLMVTCIGAITGIGTIFFVKPADRVKILEGLGAPRILKAALLAAGLGLASCAQVGQVADALLPDEVCYLHKTLGWVCVTREGSKIKKVVVMAKGDELAGAEREAVEKELAEESHD